MTRGRTKLTSWKSIKYSQNRLKFHPWTGHFGVKIATLRKNLPGDPIVFYFFTQLCEAREARVPHAAYIWGHRFPQLKSIAGFAGRSSPGQNPEAFFYLPDKLLAAQCQRFGEMLLALRDFFDLAVDPSSMDLGELFTGLDEKKSAQQAVVDDPVALLRVLYFVITAPFPLRRMRNDTGSDHVQIHINQAAPEVLPGLDGRGMVPVFPESALSTFALVVLLACSAGDQLHGFGNGACSAGVRYDEMDVIGGDGKIQDGKVIPLSGLEKPLHPPGAISGKLEKKFLLMAAMGQVPDITGNEMSVCTGHLKVFLRTAILRAKWSF